MKLSRYQKLHHRAIFSKTLKIFSNTLLLQIEKVIGTNLVLVYDLQNSTYFNEIAEDINQHKIHSFGIQ